MTDRLAYGLLLALLVLTPWPLGARLPWAGMLAAATTVTIGALWVAVALVDDRKLKMNPLFLPVAGFLVWTGLQWAAGWTVYAHGTAFEWVRYLSYAVAFALTVQLASSRDEARRLAKVVAIMGVAVGLFGLLQFLAWNGKLYWIYDPPYGGNRFGPFNNRNYFAGYMVPALGMGLGLLFGRGWQRHRLALGYLIWLAALSLLVSLSRSGVLGFAAVLGGAILLATEDRPDNDSWARRRARHGFRATSRQRRQRLADQRSRKTRRRLLIAAAVALALVAGLEWLGQAGRVFSGLEGVLELESEASLQSRLTVWGEAVEMIADRPLVGFGLNTFGWVYPRYQSTHDPSTFMHAHNEYLEILVETGLIGGLLCLWFVVGLLYIGWRRLKSARQPRIRAVHLGALTAWLGILVFSLTEFPSIIPAIDYLLAIVAGLATVEIGVKRRVKGGAGRAGERAARARRLPPLTPPAPGRAKRAPTSDRDGCAPRQGRDIRRAASAHSRKKEKRVAMAASVKIWLSRG